MIELHLTISRLVRAALDAGFVAIPPFARGDATSAIPPTLGFC
jgi:hypothetical protein